MVLGPEPSRPTEATSACAANAALLPGGAPASRRQSAHAAAHCGRISAPQSARQSASLPSRRAADRARRAPRAQRILHTDYALPAHVRASAECRDLLGRILVADPAARLSLAGIQAHAWFRAALPEGCADMNARLLEEPPEAELQAR